MAVDHLILEKCPCTHTFVAGISASMVVTLSYDNSSKHLQSMEGRFEIHIKFQD